MPSSVHGKVWSLAVGRELIPFLNFEYSSTKERKSFSETHSLQTYHSLYVGGVSVDGPDASLEESWMWPMHFHLYIFHKDDPCHDVLHSIWGAYSCYIPDIGYVQGCPSLRQCVFSFWKGQMLSLHLESSWISHTCWPFCVDHSKMLNYFRTFEVFFEDNLFKLFLHIKS